MNDSGYIAIVSVVILSLLVITALLITSVSSFKSRLNSLDTESKERGIAIAESCGKIAILKIARNSNYLGNETISVGSSTCTILPIENFGVQKIVRSKAVLNRTVTNLKMVVDAATLSIVSWDEVPNF